MGNLGNHQSIHNYHSTKYGPSSKSCWYNIKVFSENMMGHHELIIIVTIKTCPKWLKIYGNNCIICIVSAGGEADFFAAEPEAAPAAAATTEEPEVRIVYITNNRRPEEHLGTTRNSEPNFYWVWCVKEIEWKYYEKVMD